MSMINWQCRRPAHFGAGDVRQRVLYTIFRSHHRRRALSNRIRLFSIKNNVRRALEMNG